MKNTFGSALQLTLFGESHGAAVGAVLDGLSPGVPVDREEIARYLTRRRPKDALSTARREPDAFQIVSGVHNGRATGTPLCILIPNTAFLGEDYASSSGVARPGHADYTGYVKYRGYAELTGGGHFSGRITAALVAAGGIVAPALRRRGIRIGTHLRRCAGIDDHAFDPVDPLSELDMLTDRDFPVLDPEAGEAMRTRILAARADGDSVGGILETAVCGMPAGAGEPWFDSVESVLSHALFSVPAVKGVEFGDGFGLCDLRGSEANDPFCCDGEVIRTRTNRNGGINGGITNGMPLIFRCAVKPTPSVFKTQDTVDYRKPCNTELQLAGRHDPCIAHRACVVAEAVTALALADLLCVRFGTDYLNPEREANEIKE